tara:strand:- start:206 stop:355 length:150 start_codon:yes stop_codon:yes gene_type:complete
MGLSQALRPEKTTDDSEQSPQEQMSSPDTTWQQAVGRFHGSDNYQCRNS